MKTKCAILFVAFVTISVTSIFGLRPISNYRQVQQRHQERQNSLHQAKVRQGKFLNRIFTSIQPNQGGVTFCLKEGVNKQEGVGMPFSIPSPQNPSRSDEWFEGCRSFSKGENFYRKDHHFVTGYIIVQIESDGVVVGYSPSQVPPSKGPPPVGSVKLTWR
jgi:hypothetical protein